MIEQFPIYLVRRCDGPSGRARRLVGYAQLEGTLVLIEAEAAGLGWRTRIRALPAGRGDRILALAEEATRVTGRRRKAPPRRKRS